MRKLEENIMEQTVYIVDDDLDMVQAIQNLLESVNLLAKAYTSAENFLFEYKQQPGCIILDIRMKGMSGLQLQQVLQERNYNIPIIFITGHGDISMTKRALQAGAKDFFTKPFNNQELLDSVQIALQENVAQYEKQVEIAEIQGRYATLSQREQEVMCLVVDGETNKTIANKLSISISTVEAHRTKIMTKMKATSIAKLVKMALIYDLIPD